MKNFGDYAPESDQPRKKRKDFAPVSLCTFWFCTFVPEVQEKSVNKDMRQVKIFKTTTTTASKQNKKQQNK